MSSFCIDLGEQHGFWTPEGYGLRLLSRSIGEPPKDDHTERVPYSNVTYDFDAVYGASSYGERKLVYQFDYLCGEHRQSALISAQLRKYLTWQGIRVLQDSSFPDHHFEVRSPTVKVEDGQHTVHIVTITFKANPAMIPNFVPPLLQSEQRYPDVNGDGHVTASDAALILTAAEKIAAGESSGLTSAQELLADADLDGSITEADSLIVLQYAAAVSAGQFADSEQNWQKYLRRHLAMKGALY